MIANHNKIEKASEETDPKLKELVFRVNNPHTKDLFEKFDCGVDIVDTMGFDDPKTDPVNFDWIRRNIQWLDSIIFVTHLTKCLNQKSEQETFAKLVSFVENTNSRAKIVVLANMVDQYDDVDDVNSALAECKVIVNRLAPKHNIAVHGISAQQISWMRRYNKTKNFDSMDPKETQGFVKWICGQSWVRKLTTPTSGKK